MNKSLQSAFLAAALLTVGGVAVAAEHGHGSSHTSPPATSNRQSDEDADRGLDRAQERESDSGLEHSQAGDEKTEHAPSHGMDHRNADHSMTSHGKGWKNPDQ
jgi:hypothetical protein